jgi:hypothetical protein
MSPEGNFDYKLVEILNKRDTEKDEVTGKKE